MLKFQCDFKATISSNLPISYSRFKITEIQFESSPGQPLLMIKAMKMVARFESHCLTRWIDHTCWTDGLSNESMSLVLYSTKWQELKILNFQEELISKSIFMSSNLF